MLRIKKNIFTLLLIVLIAFSVNLKAQDQSKIDSLLIQFSRLNNDIEKINLSIEISKVAVKKDSILAFKHVQNAKRIATKLKSEIYLALSYSNEGGFYRIHKDFTNSVIAYTKAVGIAENIKNESLQADIHFELGRCYNAVKDFDKSSVEHLKALELRKKLNDLKKLADSYNAIGLIYKSQSKYLFSIEKFENILHNLYLGLIS